MVIGSKLHYLDEIDSTNEYAKRILDKATEGTVVLADIQTSGKGRLDRKWYSPEGGIYLSVILFTDRPLLIPILGGVAVCETFNNYGILLGLKWPNDVMLNEKKVAGILSEVIDTKVILGIGINLNNSKFPVELSDIATSIFIETRKKIDKMSIYRTLCLELDRYYSFLKANNTTEILQKWRDYTIMFSRNVRVELPDRVVLGRAIDIGGDGSLVLMLPDGKIERILAGDIQIVRV
uniref:biotin--[biotin carboxyl-carrier protein] ligase n=1 Tax=candidate division WOR-3 bacterium TaxID=2052148 RepID=A0A7C4TGI1_UNCW3